MQTQKISLAYAPLYWFLNKEKGESPTIENFEKCYRTKFNENKKPKFFEKRSLAECGSLFGIVISGMLLIYNYFKESFSGKLLSSALGLGSVGALAFGFSKAQDLNKIISAQDFQKELAETKSLITVIQKREEQTMPVSLWEKIPYYIRKIKESLADNTFKFLDDPGINLIVGGALGTLGMVLISTLRILRAQVLTATSETKASLKKCYEILELPEDATYDEIKKAYLRLAHKYHPDKNPPDRKEQAEQLFKQLNEAYNALKELIEKKEIKK